MIILIPILIIALSSFSAGMIVAYCYMNRKNEKQTQVNNIHSCYSLYETLRQSDLSQDYKIILSQSFLSKFNNKSQLHYIKELLNQF